MDEFRATEIAYQNGFEAGVNRFIDLLKEELSEVAAIYFTMQTVDECIDEVKKRI